MTQPRKALVSIDTTRYYHVTTRCVRRAFLCGLDETSGKDYAYRREWIEARIRLLASIFAIDICAYAVMSNHYHIVLRLSPEQVQDLDAHTLGLRWRCLFKGSLLLQRFCNGENLLAVERDAVSGEIDVYRNRLSNIGWFMKCLNEPLARRANREDGCKGHFWEHRYQSHALCTEEALLSCMAYVDLNPIRAGMAATPEASDHTSVKDRIASLTTQPTINLAQAIQQQYQAGHLQTDQLGIKPLLAFNPENNRLHEQIPFALTGYIELVDWTGRIIRDDKRGHIEQSLPRILESLNIGPKRWITNSTQFASVHRKRFGNKPKLCDTG